MGDSNVCEARLIVSPMTVQDLATGILRKYYQMKQEDVDDAKKVRL
jgi:hypothetical protein